MKEPRRVNLALQGGGSHGAFTWGVLDALIEDGRLSVEAVSGTSAGAMNAAILLQGWANGGPAGARAALRAFWSELGNDVDRQSHPAHAARPSARQLESR